MEEHDKYNKTLRELKDLRESQINFFYRKNDLDNEINLEKENESRQMMHEALKANKRQGEEENELDHSSDSGSIELKNRTKFIINKGVKKDKLEKEKKNNQKENENVDNEIIESEAEDYNKSEDSDMDSLEELVRKSYMNLNELTSEIK